MNDLLEWVFIAGVGAGVVFCIVAHWILEIFVLWMMDRAARPTPANREAKV